MCNASIQALTQSQYGIPLTTLFLLSNKIHFKYSRSFVFLSDLILKILLYILNANLENFSVIEWKSTKRFQAKGPTVHWWVEIALFFPVRNVQVNSAWLEWRWLEIWWKQWIVVSGVSWNSVQSVVIRPEKYENSGQVIALKKGKANADEIGIESV